MGLISTLCTIMFRVKVRVTTRVGAWPRLGIGLGMLSLCSGLGSDIGSIRVRARVRARVEVRVEVSIGAKVWVRVSVKIASVRFPSDDVPI